MEMTALKDIKLNIFPGEFLVVAGSTGSGKSTLVQHFNGLLLPTNGRVKVLGKDTTDKKHRNELWRLVGMFFQFPECQFFNATVYDDIAFGLRNLNLDEKTIARRIREALAIMGLPDEVKFAHPGKLSDGTRRLAAMAGTLAPRPKILVLDEPGAGLGPKDKKIVFDRLQCLQKSSGVTIILVTHDMEDAAAYAERVALLKGGQLLRVDKARHILADTGVLREAGLRPPYAVELADRLRQEGIHLPSMPLTVADAAKLLGSLLKQKAGD